MLDTDLNEKQEDELDDMDDIVEIEPLDDIIEEKYIDELDAGDDTGPEVVMSDSELADDDDGAGKVASGPLVSCRISGMMVPEDQMVGEFEKGVYDNLLQAYKWMQSPMLTAVEIKKLQRTLIKLSDVQEIKFD